MVTTDRLGLAEKLRRFRNHGIDSDLRRRERENRWEFEMVELGCNYRLSDISCALGLSQLQRAKANLERRRAIAGRYTEAFLEMDGVTMPSVGADVVHARHFYIIRLDLARLQVGRDEFLRALRAEGVGATVRYMPVHLHAYYRQRFGYVGGEYPVAEKAYQALINLPMFPAMSDQDVEDVIRGLSKVLRYYTQ
jgi:perosamine synthetase